MRSQKGRLDQRAPAISQADFDNFILAAESEEIRKRRARAKDALAADPDGWEEFNWPGEPPSDWVGLAFSGGGIRSATFNLGVLQKLAELKVLPLIDYLSTVSGGGFIGGWWTSWLTRKKAPGKWMPTVPESSAYKEPEEIEHLRLYGNYLVPRKGLLSGDTWRAITVVLRNWFLNVLVMLPLLAGPILVADLIYTLAVHHFLTPAKTDLVFSLGYFWDHRWLPGLLALILVSSWVLLSLVFLWFSVGLGPSQQVWRAKFTIFQTGYTAVIGQIAVLFLLALFSYPLLFKLNSYVYSKGGWLAVLPGFASGVYAAWKRGPAAGGQGEVHKDQGRLAELILKAAPTLLLISLGITLSAGVWRLLESVTLLLIRGISGYWYWGVLLIYGIVWVVPCVAMVRANMNLRQLRLATIVLPLLPSVVLLLTIVAHMHGFPPSLVAVLACLSLACQLGIGVGWGADPNVISLHSFYQARLVRAYLGASNESRLYASKRLRVTEPDKGDDLHLNDLRAWEKGGPIHIVNTTLNLVGARDLRAMQRKAEVLELTPLFCGSSRTGYRPTNAYAGGNLSLGTAIAISGAAANPVMGPLTSGSMSILLEFFNARLGYWIANPAKRYWREPWTLSWPYFMVREMVASTTDQGDFVYLSDGGHLENLGAYSLVKRRCRYLIICDAGADPEFACKDLVNLLRMLRIDFGCEINDQFLEDLKRVREISKSQGFMQSAAHAAIGTIQYPGKDKRTGLLIYIKNSLTGDEPLDVLEYARSHSTFPHQTTADQFFDEAQFESYRALGYHVAASVFGRLQGMAAKGVTRDQVFALAQTGQNT
jgi:hypothetical protein